MQSNNKMFTILIKSASPDELADVYVIWYKINEITNLLLQNI